MHLENYVSTGDGVVRWTVESTFLIPSVKVGRKKSCGRRLRNVLELRYYKHRGIPGSSQSYPLTVPFVQNFLSSQSFVVPFVCSALHSILLIKTISKINSGIGQYPLSFLMMFYQCTWVECSMPRRGKREM